MSFLYEHDILNRNSGHTLTKTTTNDLIVWELKDGSNNVVARSRGGKDNDENVQRRGVYF